MRLSVKVEEGWGESQLRDMDEEARVAYGSLSDSEIVELVERDPTFYVRRLQSLGLKWPR